jgi:hypothetical protein
MGNDPNQQYGQPSYGGGGGYGGSYGPPMVGGPGMIGAEYGYNGAGPMPMPMATNPQAQQVYQYQQNQMGTQRQGQGQGQTQGYGTGAPKISGWEKFNHIMEGIGSIYSIYAGMKGLKLAKEQFNFQKGMAETNLRNTATAHNATIGDRYAEADRLSGLSGDRSTERYNRARMNTTIGGA